MRNLHLTGTTKDKSKVKISQNFVAFSENMNFMIFVREKLVRKSKSRRAKIIASEDGLKCHEIMHDDSNKNMWQIIKSCFSMIFVCEKLVLLNGTKRKNQQIPQTGQSLYEAALDLYAPRLR